VAACCLDAARRASIKARSEIADAFAANVRPIINEIQASGVTNMRGKRTRPNGARRQDRSWW